MLVYTTYVNTFSTVTVTGFHDAISNDTVFYPKMIIYMHTRNNCYWLFDWTWYNLVDGVEKVKKRSLCFLYDKYAHFRGMMSVYPRIAFYTQILLCNYVCGADGESWYHSPPHQLYECSSLSRYFTVWCCVCLWVEHNFGSLYFKKTNFCIIIPSILSSNNHHTKTHCMEYILAYMQLLTNLNPKSREEANETRRGAYVRGRVSM